MPCCLAVTADSCGLRSLELQAMHTSAAGDCCQVTDRAVQLHGRDCDLQEVTASAEECRDCVRRQVRSG